MVVELGTEENIAVGGVEHRGMSRIAQQHIVIESLRAGGGDTATLKSRATQTIGGHAGSIHGADEGGDACAVDFQSSDLGCITHGACERDIACASVDGERLSRSCLVVELGTEEDIAVGGVQGGGVSAIAQ